MVLKGGGGLPVAARTGHYTVFPLHKAAGLPTYDDDVDAHDFNALAAGFGSLGGWASGNFDGFAGVTNTDFTVLALNYGFGSGGAPATVSEPATVTLLLALAASAAARRR